MSPTKKDNPPSNPTGSKIGDSELPAAGGSDVEKVVKNADEEENLSNPLDEISDITAELSAEIVKSAEAEKKQKLIDEKNGEIFNENLEDDFIENIDKGLESGGNKILYGLIGFTVLGGIFYFLINKRVKPLKEDIDKKLNEGVQATQKIDSYGMVQNG